MGRKIGAVIAGILMVGAVVLTMQAISTSLYPLPEGLDPMDPDQTDAFARYLAGMPASSWALTFSSEILGAFCGALVAGWIVRAGTRGVSGIIVGLAFLGSLVNWLSFTHPMWFMVGQVIAYPVALVAAWFMLGVGKRAHSAR
jgi:hypothetical protein